MASVPEQGRYGTEEGRTPEKESPRRITRLRFRRDGIGFLLDRRPHVFVLDPFPDEPAPAQVTDGDCEDGPVSWSPDGRLLFVSDRDAPEYTDLISDVYSCAVRRLGPAPPDPRRPGRRRRRSPPPTAVRSVYLGISDQGEGGDFVGRNQVLFSVPAAGGAAPTPLTTAETDLLPLGGDRLLRDGDAVLAATRRRGAQELVRIPVGGGAPEVVFGGASTVTAAAAAGGTVVVTAADATSAGELFAVGRDEPLTAFGARLTRDGGLRPLRELTATAPDGYPVHGWLVHPDPSGTPARARCCWPSTAARTRSTATRSSTRPRSMPGPGTSSCWATRAAPPATARTTPARSGTGWATVDADDLLALLDATLTTDGVDPARVGVMGGSYGGFMTTWLAGHVGDRFQAAIIERAVTAWDSFLGSSDIGYVFAAGVRRDRPGRGRRAEPADVRGQDRPPDPDHPLRAGLALPGRAGPAAVRGAQAAGSAGRAAAVPRGGARAEPVRACRATGWPGSTRSSTGGPGTWPDMIISSRQPGS